MPEKPPRKLTPRRYACWALDPEHDEALLAVFSLTPEFAAAFLRRLKRAKDAKKGDPALAWHSYDDYSAEVFSPAGPDEPALSAETREKLDAQTAAFFADARKASGIDPDDPEGYEEAGWFRLPLKAKLPALSKVRTDYCHLRVDPEGRSVHWQFCRRSPRQTAPLETARLPLELVRGDS